MVAVTEREDSGIPALLAELKQHDIRVWADGGQLRVDARAGALTAPLRERLVAMKPQILEFLKSAETLAERNKAVVPLQPAGRRPPVFAIAGHNGDVFCYRALARAVGNDQPFFGLQPPGLLPGSTPLEHVEALATYFADQVNTFRPDGPLVIAGFCAGGTIAFELARTLERAGRDVRLVALFGAPYPAWFRRGSQLRLRLNEQLRRIAHHTHRFATLPLGEWPAHLRSKLAGRRERLAAEMPQGPAADQAVMKQRIAVQEATLRAVRRYAITPGGLRLCLFLPTVEWVERGSPGFGWMRLSHRIEQYVGPRGANEDTLLREPHAARFAELFRRACDVEDIAKPARENGSTVSAARPVTT
jgi:thioesterase domain-containing protein